MGIKVQFNRENPTQQTLENPGTETFDQLQKIAKAIFTLQKTKLGPLQGGTKRVRAFFCCHKLFKKNLRRAEEREVTLAAKTIKMAADNESMKKEASETAESLIKTDQRQLKIAQEAQRLVLDFVNETERLGFFNINIKTEIFGLISEGVKLTEAAEAAKAEAATEALAQVTVALAAQAIAKANMVQVEALENKAGKATRRAVAGTIEIARKVLQ